jgi:surfactin synthase thioesterase subunit
VLRFFDGGHMFMLQDRTAVPAMIDFLLADSSGPAA